MGQKRNIATGWLSIRKAFRVCQKQFEANLFFLGGVIHTPTGIAKKTKEQIVTTGS
jgi:hypothetical protein